MELSDTDRTALAQQFTIIDYLKRQAAQLENEVVVAVLMTYGVDLRKEGAELDLKNGVVRYEPAPTPES